MQEERKFDKYDYMCWEIADIFDKFHQLIIEDCTIETKDEVHQTTQLITHIMIFLDIKYENKSRVWEAMRLLMSRNEIKHINSCKNKKDILNFLQNMRDIYNEFAELNEF